MGIKDRWLPVPRWRSAFEGCKDTLWFERKEGAIERARFNKGVFEYEVIGHVEAEGICGSGLLDIMAAFVEEGVIDETGKFDQENPSATGHMIEVDGKKAFSITEKVYVTQSDVREVQLAKAAIAAGISLMAEKLGITIQQIEKVMIAGAFGNYMSPPVLVYWEEPPGKWEQNIPIGNAAGEGAKIAALNINEFYKTEAVAKGIEFLELAINPNFQECFVDNLGF